MNRIPSTYPSIEQMQNTYLNQTTAASGQDERVSFEEALQQARKQAEQVTFSKHANERLASRNINLDSGQLERLNQGVEQAREKSIQESLVMMDNLAFIVNVRNNTVITAMDQQSNDSNIFTNIDGAVIV